MRTNTTVNNILLLWLSPSSRVAWMVMNIICQFPCLLLLHKSFHLVFCLPLRLFSGTGAPNILLRTCPSFLLMFIPPYPILSDLCRWCYFHWCSPCSFLILSFFVTLHIHLSILISTTSSLFSWLFLVYRVSAPMLALQLFCIFSPLASPASFCHTTFHCTSSNFLMLYSPYVLTPYPLPIISDRSP